MHSSFITLHIIPHYITSSFDGAAFVGIGFWVLAVFEVLDRLEWEQQKSLGGWSAGVVARLLPRLAGCLVFVGDLQGYLIG